MIVNKNKIDGISFINIDNENGLQVTLCSFGASFYDIKTNDNNNNLESVILTPKDLNDFKYSTAYYGKSVGRYSGRISNGKCIIDNKVYNLALNSLNHDSLHGGNDAISFKNFNYRIIKNDKYVKVVFSLFDIARDLPGTCLIKIIYKIYKNKNEILCNYQVTSNEDTLMNLTNHAYFNLSGNGKDTILNHKLKLYCNKYTKLDNYLITTSIDNVNEIMDFQKGHLIKKYIKDSSLVNHQANGYDHCFLKSNPSKKKIVVLSDKKSKRRLSIYTSYPSVVCYSCNYPENVLFNQDIYIKKHHAICLECQFIPNGINMDCQEKAILSKDQQYNQYIRYVFDLIK